MSFLREQPSRGEAPQPGNGHRSRKEGDRARDERCEGHLGGELGAVDRAGHTDVQRQGEAGGALALAVEIATRAPASSR